MMLTFVDIFVFLLMIYVMISVKKDMFFTMRVEFFLLSIGVE